MDLKTGLEIAGFSIVVITNIVGIVAIFTTLKNRLSFLTDLFHASVLDNKAQIVRCETMHQRHFDHAANTGIHQESMSKDTLTLHFSTMQSDIKTLGEQFANHSKQDMEIFNSVNENLQKIRDRLPPNTGAIA